MVEKTAHPQISGGKNSIRALIVGSSLAVLAVSAMSSSAYADEILPDSDPQLLTLGNESPTVLGVGAKMGGDLFNPMMLGTSGNEDGEKEEVVKETLNDGPPDQQLTNDERPEGIVVSQATGVSEPGILGLFGAGLAALGLLRRRG